MGDDPRRALAVKLLHNNLLLSQLTVVAESVQVPAVASQRSQAPAQAVLQQ